MLILMIGVTSGIALAADAPPSAASNSGPPASAVAPALAAPQPVAPAAIAVDLNAPTPLTAPAEKQPITRQWWFWTAIGAAVVGASIALYFVERTPAPPGCPIAMGYLCPR